MLTINFSRNTFTDFSKFGLTSMKESISATIDSLSNEQARRDTTMLAARVSDAARLLTDNGNISTTEQDTLTTAQVSTLSAIGSQCPSCGGDAVFRARALYALHDPAYRFVDPAQCIVSRSGSVPSKLEKETGFAIYPNPASGQVTIELAPNPENTERELLIQSITGQVVRRQPLGNSAIRQVVNTSSLKAGAYLFIIHEEGRRLHTEQVFIIK